MRRFAWLLGLAFVGMTAFVEAADAPKGITNLPLLFADDFESGNSDRWTTTDPAAWKILVTDKGKVFSQFQKKSNYEPPVRSPYNRALIKDIVVSDFLLDVKLQSTIPDYGHRDLCLFFGYQDPSHCALRAVSADGPTITQSDLYRQRRAEAEDFDEDRVRHELDRQLASRSIRPQHEAHDRFRSSSTT